MQDLLRVMNLSKSSLYQAFGSKRRLFRLCIGRYADQFASQLRQSLADAPSGWRFTEDFLRSALNDPGGAPRGRLVMNTASDLGQSQADIAQDVAPSIERLRKVLQTAFPKQDVPTCRGDFSRP